MIERLWQLLIDLRAYLFENFDPFRDTLDIVLVTFALYGLLLLIRRTRAVQMLVGLIVLIAVSLAAEILDLAAVGMILELFLTSAVLIIVIIFQHDIRRALARVGRGFFPSVSAAQESQMLEEVVRAAQALSQRRVGALVVIERETNLDDMIEAGTPVDAAVSKDLITALFLPYSPLHDGAIVIQQGRIAYAGCILPLTMREDLPEGVGTRHRAAVGIAEESDAVVVVVSEETSAISVVMGTEMVRDLDAPRLREVLRDILGGDHKDLAPDGDRGEAFETAETEPAAADSAPARSAG